MRYVLRDYQQECVDTVIDKFNELDAQLVQLPTGAGKTVILWHVLKLLGKKSLIVAPTRELTEQLEDTGIDVVRCRSIFRKKTSHWPIMNDIRHVIMTGQAVTWAMKTDALHRHSPEVIVIDEAHRSRSKNMEKLIEHYKAKGAKILGLTATPERLDGKSLLTVYDDVTFSMTLVDLINQGHLVDLECYRVKTKHKISEIRIQAGDLAASVLKELDVESRNSIILDVYKGRCPGKKTLVFCLNVSHAKKMADMFVDNGIPAAAIYGTQSRTTRRALLSMFKSGDIKVLCNCQLLTEGFDEPSIEALILARPTKSKALYCQMIGRGVRPFGNKETCLVYDMSDEIHNISTFNVLGGMGSSGNFEWKDGERLSHASERYKLTLDDVDFTVEEFNLYEKRKLDDIYAFRHQKELLSNYGIPYLNDITMMQAAYLLFKHNMMRQNGINTQDYWTKWRQFQSPSEGERVPAQV